MKTYDSYRQGILFEKNVSKTFHLKGVPLLIDPLILSSFQGGQVDMARFEKSEGEWIIILGEVKDHDLGIEKRQYKRLRRTANWLEGLFRCAVFVREISSRK